MKQVEVDKAAIGGALSLPSRNLRRAALRRFAMEAVTKEFGGELRHFRRKISRSLAKRIWNESR